MVIRQCSRGLPNCLLLWPALLLVACGSNPGYEDKNLTLTPDGRVGHFRFDGMKETALYTKATLDADTWHPITAVYDGTQAKVYFDGVLDGSMPASGSIKTGTGPLIFGRSEDFPYFAGALDEIRWYGRAISDAEVAALAAGGT